MSETNDKFFYMDDDDVLQRLNGLKIDKPTYRVYGVPRGGMCAATYLTRARLVHNPREATIILDDIIDSGATAEQFVEFGVPFMALIDKQTNPEDKKLPWVVFPWELQADETTGPASNVRRLLTFIGEDPNRDGLQETPQRVIRALQEMTRGYQMSPEDILGKTFESDHNEMIMSKDIRFSSLCEHHILPFMGTCSIGYIPNDKGQVIGISKLTRLVEVFSKRLQIQERLTNQIAQALNGCTLAKGVGVVMKAHHTCMGCRGVCQPDSTMVTSCMLGVFKTDVATRSEFLRLCEV